MPSKKHSYTASDVQGTTGGTMGSYDNGLSSFELLDKIDDRYLAKNVFEEYKSSVSHQFSSYTDKFEGFKREIFEEIPKIDRVYRRGNIILALSALIATIFVFIVPYLINREDSIKINNYKVQLDDVSKKIQVFTDALY